MMDKSMYGNFLINIIKLDIYNYNDNNSKSYNHYNDG